MFHLVYCCYKYNWNIFIGFYFTNLNHGFSTITYWHFIIKKNQIRFFFTNRNQSLLARGCHSDIIFFMQYSIQHAKENPAIVNRQNCFFIISGIVSFIVALCRICKKSKYIEINGICTCVIYGTTRSGKRCGYKYE